MINSPKVEVLHLLVKPGEAARLWAISERKLWSLTNVGAIKCVRIDRAVRYDPGDLRAWIESKKVNAQ
ncbi:MAG: helix-turn-helix domain-containing protein [Planctomycetes bacterium]|nr:helix-turn-helix domain-containing protein [Planctomycetota bacterium]MBI3836045.1 helix-turn-helix domain-containing protein [Planctomycetota bacterium]